MRIDIEKAELLPARETLGRFGRSSSNVAIVGQGQLNVAANFWGCGNVAVAGGSQGALVIQG
jgi:hypothetical protein